jgi:hypothetical protein
MTERSLVDLLFWLFYRNSHAGAGAVATCGRDAQAEPEFRAVFNMISAAGKRRP